MFMSAIKTGLILCAISIVIFLVMYVFNIQPIGILKPILFLVVTMGITITVLVVLFKNYRTQIGGFISFRDAFLYCLIALSLSFILYYIFNYLFLLLVDPEYNKNMMEAQKAWMEEYLVGKMSDEQIAEQLDKIDAEAAKMSTFSAVLKNIIRGVVFGGIISLIVAAIMKKKPELFEDTTGGAI